MRTVPLALLYYLVLTPIALLVRVFRDPLRRRWDDAATTYWVSPDRAEGRGRRSAGR